MTIPVSTLDIGEERIPPDEASSINELLELHRSIQEEVDRRNYPVKRNVHPKQHGCVQASFEITPGLPVELRHGLFAEVRTFPALVRFSNAKQTNDRLPDAHGMAIKLLDVDGMKALSEEDDPKTHDLVMIDHPVFFAKNVTDLIPLLRDFRKLLAGGLARKVQTGFKALFSRDYRFRLLRQTVAKRPDSPLTVQYWSTTPYRFGAGAVKFSARPVSDKLAGNRSSSPDRLRRTMAAQLRANEVCFDFLIQLQADAQTMPIEDPTVRWDERASPFRKVATVRIQQQTFESAEQMAFGESLSFTPWHALEAHRPLGGINRARRVLYEAMSSRRRALNTMSLAEPTVDQVQARWADSAIKTD
jgi:hypothetical protein